MIDVLGGKQPGRKTAKNRLLSQWGAGFFNLNQGNEAYYYDNNDSASPFVKMFVCVSMC